MAGPETKLHSGNPQDLTDRARVEAALIERTNERDVLRLKLAAEEEERRRIARNLHDQLGQHLTAFALHIASLRRLVEEKKSIMPRLEQLEELARVLTRDARYLSLELRPPELDDAGLAGALESYVEQWERRYEIRAEVKCTGISGPTELPDEVSSALYRIAQEALTNVARHADASMVSVVLDRPNGTVNLIIEDDGIGFDVDATHRRVRNERRLGIAGMRERAALIGGTLEIETSPGTGTSIYVRVPIAHAGSHGPE